MAIKDDIWLVVASEEILVLPETFGYELKGGDQLLQTWPVIMFIEKFTFTTTDLRNIHTFILKQEIFILTSKVWPTSYVMLATLWIFFWHFALAHHNENYAHEIWVTWLTSSVSVGNSLVLFNELHLSTQARMFKIALIYSR